MKLALAIVAIIFGTVIVGAIGYALWFFGKIANVWREDERDITERIFDEKY